MNIVDPLNRTPDEVTGPFNCRCTCSSGLTGARTSGAVNPWTDCGCQCDGGTQNINANFNNAKQ